MRPIVPIHQLGTRLPQQGRIRMGDKGPKGEPRSLKAFRFTSPDEQAIRQLAQRYGGDARPWTDARATPRNQWEVITGATEVRVFLPQESLSQWYELWSGGGIQRRCNGEVVQVPGQDDMLEVPCICGAKSLMECRPTTRLTVILPEISFGGGWMLETKGWTAINEMPAMQRMIEQLQAMGLVQAYLRMDREERMSQGRKRNFVVPRLKVDTTPLEMLEGMASVRSLASPEQLPLPALPAANEAAAERTWWEEETAPLEITNGHDEIIEAEVVDTPTPRRRQTTQNPLQVKLVLNIADASSMIRRDEVLTRHAAAWWASEGRTDSSKSLTDEERRVILKTLDDEAQLEYRGLVKLVERYEGRQM